MSLHVVEIANEGGYALFMRNGKYGVENQRVGQPIMLVGADGRVGIEHRVSGDPTEISLAAERLSAAAHIAEKFSALIERGA